jgi:hypothetical protein
MTIPDDHAYTDRETVPAAADEYQPGALTLAEMGQTDDDNPLRPPQQ